MSGACKAWNDRAFFYEISVGCIPPETKCEILAHKGSQTTGTTTRDSPPPPKPHTSGTTYRTTGPPPFISVMAFKSRP